MILITDIDAFDSIVFTPAKWKSRLKAKTYYVVAVSPYSISATNQTFMPEQHEGKWYILPPLEQDPKDGQMKRIGTYSLKKASATKNNRFNLVNPDDDFRI